jgi:hypothetical protein
MPLSGRHETQHNAIQPTIYKISALGKAALNNTGMARAIVMSFMPSVANKPIMLSVMALSFWAQCKKKTTFYYLMCKHL